MAISSRIGASLLAGAASASLLLASVAPVQAAERGDSQSTTSGGMMRGATAPAAPRAAGDFPSCTDTEFRGNAGTIHVRTSPTGNIAWAIYMHDPSDDAGPWWVDVYVSPEPGNTKKKYKVDGKYPPKQVYAPHGTVPAFKARSGWFFHLTARHVTKDGEESNNVSNSCVIP